MQLRFLCASALLGSAYSSLQRSLAAAASVQSSSHSNASMHSPDLILFASCSVAGRTEATRAGPECLSTRKFDMFSRANAHPESDELDKQTKNCHSRAKKCDVMHSTVVLLCHRNANDFVQREIKASTIKTWIKDEKP